jgi:hypothetical protein
MRDRRRTDQYGMVSEPVLMSLLPSPQIHLFDSTSHTVMSAEATPTPAAAAPTAAATTAPAVQEKSIAGSDLSKYGTHEATCDGCNIRPIVGYRYKCTKVSFQSFCETHSPNQSDALSSVARDDYRAVDSHGSLLLLL